LLLDIKDGVGGEEFSRRRRGKRVMCSKFLLLLTIKLDGLARV
jgi:hypothetical protein